MSELKMSYENFFCSKTSVTLFTNFKTVGNSAKEAIKEHPIDVRIAWYPTGESLFTLFASLTSAFQFLMELQINQFWILKGHSTINSVNEYEPDVLSTFCATRVWKLKILQRLYELIGAFATQKFCSFWNNNFSFNITHKELRISACIKFY